MAYAYNPKPSPPHPYVGPSQPPSKPGPPLFLSMPHFCKADPRLAEGVVGLQCRPENHTVFLDVGEEVQEEQEAACAICQHPRNSHN